MPALNEPKLISGNANKNLAKAITRRMTVHRGLNVDLVDARIERFNEGSITLGEIFLNPTRIYCDPVVDLIQDGPCDSEFIHAICHITGGGLSNLLRLHDSLGWHISNPLPVLPEFDWIQSNGNVSDREMYRTFNMGCGMIIAVDPSVAESVLQWIEQRMDGCAIIGHVVDNGGKVTHTNPEVFFEHY